MSDVINEIPDVPLALPTITTDQFVTAQNVPCEPLKNLYHADNQNWRAPTFNFQGYVSVSSEDGSQNSTLYRDVITTKGVMRDSPEDVGTTVRIVGVGASNGGIQKQARTPEEVAGYLLSIETPPQTVAANEYGMRPAPQREKFQVKLPASLLTDPLCRKKLLALQDHVIRQLGTSEHPNAIVQGAEYFLRQLDTATRMAGPDAQSLKPKYIQEIPVPNQVSDLQAAVRASINGV